MTRNTVAKENQRTYHRNSPPSEPLTAMPMEFRIWSSVLKSNLVTLGGTEGGTKIFAGGTLIGYVSVGAGSRWTTSDPVTGSTVKWAGSNGVWTSVTEDAEPLGQVVSNYDPVLEDSPGYGFAMRNSEFPEWQCTVAEGLYGEFSQMPFECQFREMLRLASEGEELWKEYRKEQNPVLVEVTVTDTVADENTLQFRKLMNKSLSSSRKPIDDPESKENRKKRKFEVTVESPTERIITVDMSDTG